LEDDPLIAKLEDAILAWFDQKNPQPLTRSELARNLSVPPKERSALRAALQGLENQGRIQRFKKGRYGPPEAAKSSSPRLTGTIEFPSPKTNRNAWISVDSVAARQHPKGFHGDLVFVPARFAGTALPGDHVAFTFVERPGGNRGRKGRRPAGHHREHRWQARVSQIVHRKRTRFTALLKRDRGHAHAVPDDPVFPRPFEIAETGDTPETPDHSQVVVELLHWTAPSRPPVGRVVEVLGKAGEPGVDILKIIRQYDLPHEFPREVAADAAQLPAEVREEETESREDWRSREVYTIDPATARDFDDAICVTPAGEGTVELAVFVADVAHYVKPGSPIDREARQRGNSVYLVDRVIPMLPEALSNGICSLNPAVDRLAHGVVLTFDAEGARQGVRFVKAVIRSQRRFSYEEAYELLQFPEVFEDPEDPEEARFHGHLQAAWNLASRLRKRRMAAGSLDLDFPEVDVLLDADGTPVELRLVEYDESHQLIEEFMLAANEAVAEFIKNRQAGAIYRVHEDPDPGKLLEFRDLALAYGYEAGDLTHRRELQKLIADIKGSVAERALSLALLKSLKRANYSAEPLGHYGLAKANYTHFTSPIRRYSDLVVHRVLEKLATAPDPAPRLPKRAELEEIAEHLSERERVAADAERDSKMLKQFEFLLQLTRSEKRTRFTAIVLEVAPKGVFVEIQEYYLRGLIRKFDLPRHRYFLEPRSQRVLDNRGHLLMAPGMSLAVELKHVDVEQRFLDFVPAEEP